MERSKRKSLIRIFAQTPFSVPILGRVMHDLLRRRAPLASLLQSKLGHSTTPSLALSFSPFPAGDLVSRENQKTRKFGVGGGLLEGRVSKKIDGQDQFLEFPGVRRKIRPCGWKEHEGISLPSKIQPDQTARLGDISNPS